MSTISGYGGRLTWGKFPIAVEDWIINWNKSSVGMESWRGRMIISKTDYESMVRELTKSGPIDLGQISMEPIPAEFYKKSELYSGRLIASLSIGTSAAGTLYTVNFKGTGPLTKGERL